MKIKISKSNKFLFAQLIDESGKTLLGKRYAIEKDKSTSSGKDFGASAFKSGAKKISFDRNKNKYHGMVKSFADGLREAGLEF